MKVTTPEISWHNKEPVHSVDIQKKVVKTTETETVYRIATGGGDCHVVIWHAYVGEEVRIEFASDLNRHQKTVNVVKFSPSGEYLASGDDDGSIIIWRQKAGNEEQANLFDETSEESIEHWTALKVLRGHLEDVYDLNWSPDSKGLASGSVDNSVILWNVEAARKIAVLKDHKGLVQGVSWCPSDKMIASVCTDRICRIFSTKNYRVIARIHQAPLNTKLTNEDGTPQQFRLFHDDTLGTFYRRLSFSPDGELLIVPAGIICPREQRKKQHYPNATFVFSTKNLKQPVMYLPTGDRFTVAVSFCPVFFELIPGSDPVVPLPYRLVWAVATQNSVLLYDSQHSTPLAFISHIHYTRLSDISWSPDGNLLVVASSDGYCSCINFSPGELGTPVPDQQKYIPQVKEVKKGKGKRKNNVTPAQPKEQTSEPVVEDVVMKTADTEEEEIKLVLEETQDVMMETK
ncbi:chromatin assembly factor 1 subunit B [Neocloeon triangulifer]|uniref:chromatin assembly factor 1 subunit B n=1 Tax=Neocloeon triangulifer TaxID=2078957 RepID=UPI00286F042A|nr:chromatin assembly factor 1 subunit B [Neocloeon triangulifer]